MIRFSVAAPKPVNMKVEKGAVREIDGVTFFPSVDEEGNLSWENNGGLDNPETVNIKGKKGYTPVKGTDYYTEADKAEMVAAVLAALPDAEKETF